MKKRIEYSIIEEFKKDFKGLEKKFKTLEKDFELMKKMLLEPHFLNNLPTPPKALVDIEGFCSENYQSKKIIKFACASLKGRGGNSGIRVIFVYEKEKEVHKITFIEIYFKGDKELENKERLKEFLKTLDND